MLSWRPSDALGCLYYFISYPIESKRNMSIQTFHFDGHPVRVVVHGNSEPLFVAEDVCDILDCPAGVFTEIDPADLVWIDFNTSTGCQLLLNDCSLYGLVDASRWPEKAKRFEQWIDAEVRPAVYAGAPRRVAALVVGDEEVMFARVLAMAERRVQQAERGEISADDPKLKRARRLIAFRDEADRLEEEEAVWLQAQRKALRSQSIRAARTH